MNEFAWKINLQLFGEGGGAGAAAGAGEASGAGDASGGENAPANTPTTTNRRGKANPLANVVYGKQPEEEAPDTGTPAKETDTTVTTDTDAQRQAAFDAFIRDNKDLYDARVNSQLDRRFKHQSEMEAQIQASQPVLEMLMQKHGVKTVQELQAAIEADDSYWEAEADERGMTVEQLKQFKQMERENAAFKAAAEARSRQEGMQRVVTRWTQEAEALKQRFPDFDLQREINDPVTGERFVALLRSGEIDVGTAYQLIHMDELMSGAIGYAVRTTKQQTLNNIRARGMRPGENGAGGNAPAAIVKRDPSKYTKADRDEIARRVMRGERIEL